MILSMAPIRRRVALPSCRAWVRATSGISRPESAVRKENGKNSSGSAIPFRLPYWVMAAARLPV